MKRQSTKSRSLSRPNGIILTFITVLGFVAYVGGRVSLIQLIGLLLGYLVIWELWVHLLRPVVIAIVFHRVINERTLLAELSEYLSLNLEPYHPSSYDLIEAGTSENYDLVVKRIEAIASPPLGVARPSLEDYLRPLALPELTQNEREILLRLHLPTILSLAIADIEATHNLDNGRYLLTIMRRWEAV